MRSVLSLALALFIPAASAAQTIDAPSTSAIIAMGAYVPSDDIQKSGSFYRTLFNRAPTIELPDFVAFNIEGGWFAIVSRDRYAPGAEPGSGAIPYLQSADLEVLQSRVAATGAAPPEIIKEPGIHLLKITDPNGQLIEFFQLAGK